MIRPPPKSTLFPYTTLFRSVIAFQFVAGPAINDIDAEVLAPVFAPFRLGEALDDEGQFFEVLRYADRKSTRLNSSHSSISYAVFCLKKKKKIYRKRY